MSYQRKLICKISAIAFAFAIIGGSLSNSFEVPVANVYAAEEAKTDNFTKELFVDPLDENNKYYIIKGVIAESETVQIPSEIDGVPVKEIAEGAFRADSKLKKLVIAEGVEKIGYSAFAHCKCLETVDIPSSVTDVSAGSFYGTPWLEDNDDRYIIVGDDVLIMYQGAERKPILPKRIKHIAKEAFFENEFVMYITLPEGVLDVSDYAFSNCTNIKRVTLNTSLTHIGQFAFYNCGMREITIPKSVKFIGPCAAGYYADMENVYSGLVQKFKIIGYKNSGAHKYALENGIWFEEYINAFDVSGDCKVDVHDIKAMNSHILCVDSDLDVAQSSDYNADGTVNVFDLMRLKRQIINDGNTENTEEN